MLDSIINSITDESKSKLLQCLDKFLTHVPDVAEAGITRVISTDSPDFQAFLNATITTITNEVTQLITMLNDGTSISTEDISPRTKNALQTCLVGFDPADPYSDLKIAGCMIGVFIATLGAVGLGATFLCNANRCGSFISNNCTEIFSTIESHISNSLSLFRRKRD